MKVHIVGEVDDRLLQGLQRRLLTDVATGLPERSDPYVCVAVGQHLPGAVLDDARVRLLVIVEPGLQVRDGVMRALAAREVPALEIVEHVAAGIQADRTWALATALAMGLGGAEISLREQPASRADLVKGPPRGGSWTGHAPVNLAGLTIGFLGFGPMAEGVAERARLSGMNSIYWPQFGDRAHREECEARALRTGAWAEEFTEVLAGADVLVLDLLYTPESVRLLDSPELALLRHDAFLVNTSHSRAIDEGALVQLVRSGALAGVALDRFNYEPLPDDSPLRTLDRLVLTPGIAVPDGQAVADETARKVADAITRHVPEIGQRIVRRYVQRKRVS